MVQIKHRITCETILELDNLSGADLSDANLRGADLSGANLRGADLSGALVFSGYKLIKE